MLNRKRRSFGFGKKFGIAHRGAVGKFKSSRQGIPVGGSKVLAMRHKGPKSTRKGAVAFFHELGGTKQKSFARKRR